MSGLPVALRAPGQSHLHLGHDDVLTAGGLTAHGAVLADGEHHRVALLRQLHRAVDAADLFLPNAGRGFARHVKARVDQTLLQRYRAVGAAAELPGAQLVEAVGKGRVSAIFAPFFSGSAPLFLSSTADSAPSLRATARCSDAR